MTEAELVELCEIDELEVGDCRRFDTSFGPVCLVRVTEGFRAICDNCSHEDYPLSEGEVDLDEGLIECGKHGSMFSLETGEPVCLPATQSVAVYEVSVRDGKVAVKAP